MLIEFTIHEEVRGIGGDQTFVNPDHVIQVYLCELEKWETGKEFIRGKCVTRIRTFSDRESGTPVMGDIREVVAKLNGNERTQNPDSLPSGHGFVECLGSGAPNDPRS